jgi:ferritin-like metal-binding protein YciE
VSGRPDRFRPGSGGVWIRTGHCLRFSRSGEPSSTGLRRSAGSSADHLTGGTQTIKEQAMSDHDLQERLVTYLADVHALEENALAQLKSGVETVGDERLRQALRQHLTETEQHERLVAERLSAYGESNSTLKDLAHKGSAMVVGMTAKASPDTTGKIAIQAFAFEHVEIASYRMLCVVAERSGDTQTLQVARRILEEEETAARKLEALLEQVAEYDLRELTAAA